MWNKQDLEAKLKYLDELFKNTRNKKKKSEILVDKITILKMLELLKGRRITLYNDPLLFLKKLSLKRDTKKCENYESLEFFHVLVDLKYSFELCKNLALIPYIDLKDTWPLSSEEECINEVVDFARKINDPELGNAILSVINDKDHLYLSTGYKDSELSKYKAVNFELSTFKESYIMYPPKSSILLHEVVHTIDNKINGYNISSYPYSGEVPATALEIYKDTIEGNMDALINLLTLAKKTIIIACKQNPNYFSLTETAKLEFQDVKNRTRDIIERFLTVKSYLIAVVFAKKMIDNEKEGLKEYKELLKTKFPKDSIPDYSKWGITNEVIIDYSKNLINYFSEYQKDKEKGGKSI